MKHKKKLKKLTKQLFPVWQYPFHERRNCRKILYEDMLSYWHEHPDTSLEDIKQIFCDAEDHVSNENPLHNSKRQKLFFLGLVVIIMLCVILIFFSFSWDAPTTQL